MANRLNISFPEDTRAQIDALAPLFGENISHVVRVAIAQMHQRYFPEQHDNFEEPYIKEWEPFVPAKPVVCSDLGITIPAGSTAYREVWSDGRQGDILSRESLIADGVIID